MSSSAHRILIVLPLCAFLGLTGCRNGPAVGRVSGKVTFEGKPVKQGRVSFQNPQTGVAEEAVLDKDGNFSVRSALPVGEYKVIVFPLIVHEKAEARGPVVGVERPAPDIPEKYRTIGSTDLKATVKEGDNDLAFDMKR